MKKTVLFAIILTIALIALGSLSFGQTALDDLTPTVVLLHCKKDEGLAVASQKGSLYQAWGKRPNSKDYVPLNRNRPTSGTGFFVQDEANNYLYLITAEHLALALTINCSATMQAAGDRPITLPMSELSGSTDDLNWVLHGDADVAVLRLQPKPEIFNNHLQRHFMPFSFLSEAEYIPPRHIPLTVLGFPLTLGAKDRFSPISRESKPSSGMLTLQRADTKRPCNFFLLEDTSIGGFSGAPLFDIAGGYFTPGGGVVARSGKPKCVGLIHGTIGDPQGRMTAVVPSSYIWATIKKAQHQ